MTGAVPTNTMRAHVQREYGPVSLGGLDEVPVPTPGPHQVLLEVAAASLNPADVWLATGSPWVVRASSGLTRRKNPVLGQDVVGTVVGVGEKVTTLKEGDVVFGGAHGSLAEFTVADAKRLALAPSTLTAEEAVGAPMVGITAMAALKVGRIKPGDRILINGAGGGIGHIAVQLARQAGAEVTAVCSTRNVELVRELGADHVIDYTEQSVLDAGGEYDIILDNVGNHRIRELRRLLAPRGTLLPNSGKQGPDGGGIARLLRTIGTDLITRQRLKFFVTDYEPDKLELLAGELDAGRLRVAIDNLFALDQAGAAMQRVADGHVHGKVIVTVSRNGAAARKEPS